MLDTISFRELVNVRSKCVSELLAHLRRLDERLAVGPSVDRDGRGPEDLEPTARRIVVLGPPGLGKTEVLKRHVRAAARRMHQQVEQATTPLDALEFPVYLDMRKVGRAPTTTAAVCAFLAKRGDVDCHRPLSPEQRAAGALLIALDVQHEHDLSKALVKWLWHRLTHPRVDRPWPLLLCLDTWDEVRAGRPALAAHLGTLTRMGDVRIVLASRVDGYHAPDLGAGEQTGFQTVNLSKYNPDDVKSFVQQFFAAKPAQGDEMLRQLRDRPALARQMQTPLIATVICVYFARVGRLPRRAWGSDALRGPVLADLFARSHRGVGPDELWSTLTPSRNLFVAAAAVVIVAAVATAIFQQSRAPTIVAPDDSRAAARVETTDPEAAELYAQGRVHLNRRTAPTLLQAIDLFERAVARDPQYARAQAALAVALAVLPSYVRSDVDEVGRRAEKAARRATALDPTIADSYTALGYVSLLAGRNAAADRYFQEALARDSSTATAWGWYGLLANHVGDVDSAHKRIARARRLEPGSHITRIWDAYVFTNQRRYPAADSAISATLAMDSTFTLAYVARAEVWVHQGRAADAVRMLEPHVRSAPPPSSDAEGVLVWAYARAGQTPQARQLLASIRERNGGVLPPTGTLATALDALGDRAEAVELLERAVKAHDPWLVQYSRSARYDALRRVPGVKAVLAPIETM